MLVLSRRPGQKIVIGNEITIEVVSVSGAFEMFRFEMLRTWFGLEMFRKGLGFDGFQTSKPGV